MKQEKLFKKQEKENDDIKTSEKRREAAIERKKDYQKRLKIQREKNLRPKNEYFTCSCGLRMHWKVAWGRRDGCPKCNKRFTKKDIFIIEDD